jgi:hypothetical protein
MSRRAGLTLALMLCAPLRLAAVDLGGGSVGADWIRLDADARSAGMAGAMTAVDGGLSALGSDPAGLAALDRPALMAGYKAWVAGTSVQSLALGLPWGPGVLALSADNFSAGAVDRVGAPVNGGGPLDQGSVDLLFLRLGLTWAQTLGPFQAGVSLHVLDQSLDNAAAWGIYGDLGLRWRAPLPGLSLGAALQDWGPPLQGADLPRAWRAGAAYRPPTQPLLLLSADYVALAGDPNAGQAALGVEVTLHPRLSLRGGVLLGAAAASQGCTAGASFHVGGLTLHYAFQLLSGLDATHGLSLEYSFAAAPKPPPPPPPNKKAKHPAKKKKKRPLV